MKPKTRKLLEWLDSSQKLESQIVASGLSGALNDALAEGWCDMTGHPTVRERGVPAAVAFITTTGRRALRP